MWYLTFEHEDYRCYPEESLLEAVASSHKETTILIKQDKHGNELFRIDLEDGPITEWIESQARTFGCADPGVNVGYHLYYLLDRGHVTEAEVEVLIWSKIKLPEGG